MVLKTGSMVDRVSVLEPAPPSEAGIPAIGLEVFRTSFALDPEIEPLSLPHEAS